jgi:hypothetical protein
MPQGREGLLLTGFEINAEMNATSSVNKGEKSQIVLPQPLSPSSLATTEMTLGHNGTGRVNLLRSPEQPHYFL